MKMKAVELSDYLNGELIGSPDISVRKPVPLTDAGEGDTTILWDNHLDLDKKVCILVSNRRPVNLKYDALIVVKDVREAFIRILKAFAPVSPKRAVATAFSYIAEDAFVDKNATLLPFVHIESGVKIEKGVYISPFVFIGEGSVVGEGTFIYPHVFIGRDVIIGKNNIVHAGASIGADGFGFEKNKDGYVKIPQIGGIKIGDNCEIGANSTVDRATIGYTIIEDGVKLDDQVHIGHNCRIKKHTVVAGQSGIAGSSSVGEWVMLAGQVGIADHLNIADRTIIMAKSGVSKNTEPGKIYMGYFARERREYLKERANLRKLPELIKKLEALEKKLEEKNP